MNPKLGAQWTYLWIPAFMVKGETYESLAQHAAEQGVQVVTVRWGESDHKSYNPHGEPRPGEFWYGGKVRRDANGDILTKLFTKDEPAPDDSPMRQLLDACARHDLKVVFQLGEITALVRHWDYHAYKAGRLTPTGSHSAKGVKGWLTSKKGFFSNHQAQDAFKQRIDAFVTSFGGHPAIWCVDLGNEYTHVLFWDDDDWETSVFFPWVEEMSTYLWNALPGPNADKPYLTISEYRAHKASDPINDVYNYFTALPADKVMITWHNYNRVKTLSQIRDAIYATQDRYPNATVRVGENWPWYVSTRPVPSNIRDINIPPEAYEQNGVFDPVSLPPYEHERMYAFLLAAIPRTADYCRWWGYVDDIHSKKHGATVKRLAEILRPAKDLTENATLDGDTTRHTDRVTGAGLTFKAAALCESNGCLVFVLVGSGQRTVNFGVSGDWSLVTYDWTADDGQRVIDQQAVDPSAVGIDFSQYPRGFCAGYLVGEVAEPTDDSERIARHARDLKGIAEDLKDIAEDLSAIASG